MEELKVPSLVRDYFKAFAGEPAGESSEAAKVCRNASYVWNWLKQSKAPAEIIGAFDDLCEHLGVPYVIVD